jgi:hypothetical protein
MREGESLAEGEIATANTNRKTSEKQKHGRHVESFKEHMGCDGVGQQGKLGMRTVLPCGLLYGRQCDKSFQGATWPWYYTVFE